MPNISVPRKMIADFCRRWQIVEFAFFGSVLQENFGPDSDIDILVTFAPEADWSLFDQLRMEEELSKFLNHEIDLFSKRAVEQSHNWLRSREILNSARVIYAA